MKTNFHIILSTTGEDLYLTAKRTWSKSFSSAKKFKTGKAANQFMRRIVRNNASPEPATNGQIGWEESV